jgi:hypothetical protein
MMKNKEELFKYCEWRLEVGDCTMFVTGALIQYVTPNDCLRFSEQPLGEAMKELDDLLQTDMEDQMTLLSFEVLKTEEVAEQWWKVG